MRKICFDTKHQYSVVVSAFVFIIVAAVPSFAAVVVVLNFKNKTEAKPLTFSFHDNRE